MCLGTQLFPASSLLHRGVPQGLAESLLHLAPDLMHLRIALGLGHRNRRPLEDSGKRGPSRTDTSPSRTDTSLFTVRLPAGPGNWEHLVPAGGIRCRGRPSVP